jgi:hypothetical protein
VRLAADDHDLALEAGLTQPGDRSVGGDAAARDDDAVLCAQRCRSWISE